MARAARLLGEQTSSRPRLGNKFRPKFDVFFRNRNGSELIFFLISANFGKNLMFFSEWIGVEIGTGIPKSMVSFVTDNLSEID